MPCPLSNTDKKTHRCYTATQSYTEPQSCLNKNAQIKSKEDGDKERREKGEKAAAWNGTSFLSQLVWNPHL